jgi:hypothetical protein
VLEAQGVRACVWQSAHACLGRRALSWRSLARPCATLSSPSPPRPAARCGLARLSRLRHC